LGEGQGKESKGKGFPQTKTEKPQLVIIKAGKGDGGCKHDYIGPANGRTSTKQKDRMGFAMMDMG